MADLILVEAHEAELRQLLTTSDGSEASAYLLLGRVDISADPWTGSKRRRFVSRRVVPVPDEDRVSASAVHVTWSTRSFVRLLKQAEEEGLLLAIVHTHPGSTAFFSPQDERNESDLLRIVTDRSGTGAEFASIVLGGDGSVCGRVQTSPGTIEHLDRIMVAGRRLSLHLSDHSTEHSESLDGQARLFGPSFNPVVRALRVGVASPTAPLTPPVRGRAT